jgi:hypothetical protein
VTVQIAGGSPPGSALFPIPEGRGTPPLAGLHRAVVPDVLAEKKPS